MSEFFFTAPRIDKHYKVQIRPTDKLTKEILILYSVLGFTGHVGKAISWKFHRSRSKPRNIHVHIFQSETRCPESERLLLACNTHRNTCSSLKKSQIWSLYPLYILICIFGTYAAVKQTDFIEDFELLITQGHKIQIFCNNIFQICNFKIS